MNRVASSSAPEEEHGIVSPWYDRVKRVLDIIVASAGILLGLPVWLMIAVLVKLTSSGPIFYVTESMGRQARPFRLFKFRTMRYQADEHPHLDYLAEYVRENKPYAIIKDENGREQRVYKVINDGRLTPVGRFLRATGLDEAPQFINVLRGEMSMVGPRPPRPEEYIHYDEWHKQRLTVLPGITCIYEIKARSVASFDQMVKMDLEYIRKRSLWLDLKIMAMTPINVIILRKGGF